MWPESRHCADPIAIGDEPKLLTLSNESSWVIAVNGALRDSCFHLRQSSLGAGPGEPNDDRLRRKQPQNELSGFPKKTSWLRIPYPIGLPWLRESWYLWKMNDSWIAIVDRQGLRQLVLETSHAIPFLLRRASRENAECFWAVLQPQHAAFIEQLRCTGNLVAALRWLDYLATDVGRIAPTDSLIPSWLSDDVTIPDGHDKDWIL